MGHVALALMVSACARNRATVGTLETVWARRAVSINLTAPFVALAPGTIGHAQVDVRDSTGRILTGPVRWKSSRPDVVEVRRVSDRAVDLLYQRPGRAVFSATAAGTTDAVILYVGRLPRTATIRLHPERLTVQANDFIRVRAALYDSSGQRKPALWVRWAWSDSTRVRLVGVPDGGAVILKALEPGCVTITATEDSVVARGQLKIGRRGGCG